jgi:hypothetical protein
VGILLIIGRRNDTESNSQLSVDREHGAIIVVSTKVLLANACVQKEFIQTTYFPQ